MNNKKNKEDVSTKVIKEKKKEKKKQKQVDKLWQEEMKRINMPLSEKIKKQITRERIIIAVFVVIVFCVFIKVAVPKIIYNLFEKKVVYYVKDNNLYGDKNKNKILSEDVFEEDIIKNDTMSNKANSVLKMRGLDFDPIYDEKVGVSIFVKEYSRDDEEYDLYVKSLNNSFENFDIKKVKRGTFKISKDKREIMYEKKVGEKYNLYVNDYKEEKMIDENVIEYFVTKNLKELYYNKDGEIHTYNRKEDINNLIATNSFIVKDEFLNDNVEYLEDKDSDNFYYGYWTNENKTVFTLYEHTKDGEILIDENLTGDVLYFKKDNYLYYTRQNTEPVQIKDYVIDDITDGSYDKEEPRIEDYSFGMGFFSMPDYGAYYSALSEWQRVKNFKKNNEETFNKYVQQIEKGTYNAHYKKLYYYDGKEKDTFCEQNIKSLERAKGYKTYIFFEAYKEKTRTKKSDSEKKKLSDIIKSNITISSYMKSVRDEGEVYRYIYHKNEGMRINNLSGATFELYESKNKYIIKSISADKMYNYVYSIEFKAGIIGEAKLYGRYMTNYLYVYASPYIENVIWSVDYGYNRSYLYVDEKEIDRNVITNYDEVTSAIMITNDLKKIVYLKDYNAEKGTGVLCMVEDGVSKQIYDSVLWTSVKTNALDSSIYYIGDFDPISLNGNLYNYNKFRNNVLVDENVNSIINIYKNEERIKLYNTHDNKKTSKFEAGLDFGENNYQKF